MILQWENEMRLGMLLAVNFLVLATLVSSFSQTFSRDEPYQQPFERMVRTNTDDHMSFTRELADHSAKLDTLKSQHDAMSDVPVRMARIEERLDLLGQITWTILVGIAGLIGKEIWYGIRALKVRGKG